MQSWNLSKKSLSSISYYNTYFYLRNMTLLIATIWMLVSLPNASVEILMPDVRALGGGDFGR